MLSLKEQYELLDEYMEFRALWEDVDYELTPEFFEGALRDGTRSFFGVVISDDGELVDDFQNPDAYCEWRYEQSFASVDWKESPYDVLKEVDAMLRRHNLQIEHYDGDTGDSYMFRVVELKDTA